MFFLFLVPIQLPSSVLFLFPSHLFGVLFVLFFYYFSTLLMDTTIAGLIDEMMIEPAAVVFVWFFL